MALKVKVKGQHQNVTKIQSLLGFTIPNTHATKFNQLLICGFSLFARTDRLTDGLTDAHTQYTHTNDDKNIPALLSLTGACNNNNPAIEVLMLLPPPRWLCFTGVCLSVCLFVCLLAISRKKTTYWIFIKILQ